MLFLLMVYVMALVFRELLGREDRGNIRTNFETVAKAMLTTFRCSFGDCSGPTGDPIFTAVNEEYGALHTLLLSLFVFVVTIGVFNVISAIFVQSTMASALKVEEDRKSARLADRVRWSTSICTLIERLLELSP